LRSSTLLSEALPEYDFRERHSRRVGAPPERVFAAVRELCADDTPFVRLLFRLRGLRGDTARPIFEQMGRFGFEVLAEEPGREVVVAAIGQPWKVRGGARPRGVDFRTFAEPGYAKMALNWRLEDGVLSTETRVQLTDAHARRAFRRYWLVIRPFSGVIRRAWLRAVTRRAASASRPRRPRP
jgi:hypothetical protein